MRVGDDLLRVPRGGLHRSAVGGATWTRAARRVGCIGGWGLGWHLVGGGWQGSRRAVGLLGDEHWADGAAGRELLANGSGHWWHIDILLGFSWGNKSELSKSYLRDYSLKVVHLKGIKKTL